MRKILIKLIRAYRLFISPLSVPNCRYSPTCSQYAIEAIEKHGAYQGTILSIKRISRCHPFAGSGYDPVPEQKSTSCQCSPKG